MESNEETYTIDLMRLLRALWHNALIIVLATVLGGLLLLSWTLFFVTPQYQAAARMYVNNSMSVGSVSISASDLTASQSLVDTYMVIMTSRTTLNEVIDESGVSYTAEELKKMISSEAVNDTEVFEITVTDPNPEEAELIANTITRVLPDKIDSIIEGSSARIVDTAIVPSTPVSPSIARNTVIGAVIGFVVACICIIIAELVNDRINTEEDLSQVTKLPVLAVIPDLVASRSGGYGYGRYGYGYGYGRSGYGYGYGYGYGEDSKKKKKKRDSDSESKQDGSGSEGQGES
ncbi:MAG: Wzz/FepE/Etk N-terminal domain-containing protein [Bacteroidales bacterium]|nr:Wzz/FepE/Etk N-terminal domain-containing protein [Bacteroidales bacterium]